MDIKSEKINNQLINLLDGPKEEALSGEVVFNDNTFLVFQGVKREDLVYIKEYIEEMRVKNIEIQAYDGSSKSI